MRAAIQRFGVALAATPLAATGTMTAALASARGSLDQRWHQVGGGGKATLGGASPITVASGASSPLDFQVAQGARLKIDVVNADGTAPQGYLVGIITLVSGEYVGDFDYSDGQTFGSNALPGGSYILRVDDENGDSYWYDGATSADAATPVSLTRGQTKRVTFHLPG